PACRWIWSKSEPTRKHTRSPSAKSPGPMTVGKVAMTQVLGNYSRQDIERIVRTVLQKQMGGGVAPAPAARNPLVVNISARHVHLTQEHVEILFGKGSELEPTKWLYQDGYYAAKQTVAVLG